MSKIQSTAPAKSARSAVASAAGVALAAVLMAGVAAPARAMPFLFSADFGYPTNVATNLWSYRMRDSSNVETLLTDKEVFNILAGPTMIPGITRG
ncbi:MAG: hypothetical protein ABI306_02990 [Caulobacteraceae bacterium]